MRGKRTVIGIIIALIAIGGGIILYVNNRSSTDQRQATSQSERVSESSSSRSKRQSSSQQSSDEIDGQSINAPQLSKSDGDWQNGAGTKSDGKDTNSTNTPTRKLTKDAKSIIIYYSRSGSTELLASKIAQRTNADILEIVVKDTYSGNYNSTRSRADSERENEEYPELNMRMPDLSQYDTVYLGYPIWAMQLSHPMISFLNVYGRQLSNKQIAPFMTQGGYGQGESVKQIRQILRREGASDNTYSSALVVDGNKVDRANSKVKRWTEQISEAE